MKKKGKKILIIFLIGFVAIQLIRPPLNNSSQLLQTDIVNLYLLPEKVHSILKRSCYDCHSNNTNYPWYSYIQPFGLWLNKHIKNGKEDLTFSDFGSYKGKRQINKLNAIENSIKDGTMPLSPYLVMHGNARLTEADKNIVIQWINKVKDSITIKN